MDIERFKRLSVPKIEAGKMTQVVRDVIKEVRTNKQNVYEKTSDYEINERVNQLLSGGQMRRFIY